MRAADTPSSLYAQPPQLGGHQRFKQRVLVSCPRSLWTKRRAGRGAPPRNTLSRNPHLALVRSHESEATASGNAQKPRFRGGAPRPARHRESTDFRDTTLAHGSPWGRLKDDDTAQVFTL